MINGQNLKRILLITGATAIGEYVVGWIMEMLAL